MGFNFATNKWEDDPGPGIPPVVTPPVAAAPAVPSVPGPAQSTPAGTTVLFPRPEHETSSSSQTRDMGPASRAARLGTVVAQGELATAREGVGEAEAAGHRAAAAEAEETARKREEQLKAQRTADEADQRRRDDFFKTQKEGIAAEAQAKKKAGAADAEFWKGNEAGEVAVALMRAIQSGIQGYRGTSGPTDVERIVEAKMRAHEKRLVGEWESEQEKNKNLLTNHEEQEKGSALTRVAAANQNAAEVTIIADRARAFAKNLDAEKALKLTEQANKLEAFATAKAAQTWAQEYDPIHRASQTDRTPSSIEEAAKGAEANKRILQHLNGATAGRTATESQGNKIALQRDAVNKQKVLREKLAELGPKIQVADRISNMVLRDKLVQDFNTTLTDLGSQISIANGQASMTGAERTAFNRDNARGWLQDPQDYVQFLQSQQASAEKQYDEQVKGASLEGSYIPPRAPAPSGDKGDKAEGKKSAYADGATVDIDGVPHVVRNGKAVPK